MLNYLSTDCHVCKIRAKTFGKEINNKNEVKITTQKKGARNAPQYRQKYVIRD